MVKSICVRYLNDCCSWLILLSAMIVLAYEQHFSSQKTAVCNNAQNGS